MLGSNAIGRSYCIDHGNRKGLRAMTQVSVLETTSFLPPAEITSWAGLSADQQGFVLRNWGGPPPKDMGVVNMFTRNFIGQFGVKITPATMHAILTKAGRKAKRSKKSGSKGVSKKRIFGNRRQPRFVA